MLLRRKPNACAECFRQRARCEFLDGAAARGEPCERCRKLGRTCTPRVALRGKDSHVNKWGSGTPDSEAYRGFSIITYNRTTAAYYNGAAAIVNTYKALGLHEAPLMLCWWLHGLFLLAKTSRSLERLHAVTCCSISVGAPINVDLLNHEAPPLAWDECTELTAQVVRDDLRREGALFMCRHVDGARSLACNHVFEELFEPMEPVAPLMTATNNPALDIWRRHLADGPNSCQEETNRFFSKVILTAFMRNDLEGSPPHLRFAVESPDEFRIKDNQGNFYRTKVLGSGVLAFDGRVQLFTFGFRGLVPEDAAGAARLAAARRRQREMAASLPGVPHFYPTACSGQLDVPLDADAADEADDTDTSDAPSSGTSSLASAYKGWPATVAAAVTTTTTTTTATTTATRTAGPQMYHDMAAADSPQSWHSGGGSGGGAVHHAHPWPNHNGYDAFQHQQHQQHQHQQQEQAAPWPTTGEATTGEALASEDSSDVFLELLEELGGPAAFLAADPS